jgi:hydrogenase maturation protease
VSLKSQTTDPDSQRTLILGLGNDLLRDDAIGLRIVEELRRSPGMPSGVSVAATTEMGLSLLDHMAGFSRVIIIDSVQTQNAPPGHMHVVGEHDIPTLPLVSPHFLGIGEVLALGRSLGMEVADNVLVVAIEVADPFTVSPSLSPELEVILPSLVDRVKELAVQNGSAKS